MSMFDFRTLTGQTLARLALSGSVILLLTSAVSTAVLYLQVEDHATERLALRALERARIAERVLGQTVESHEAVRRAFVEKWPSYQGDDTLRRFDKLFMTYPDGATRNRPEISDGRKWSTGWIRRGEPLNDDLRRRFVLFFDLSQQFGPGMVVRDDNLFFTSLPEQANMGYDPILYPDWILAIPPDFDQKIYEWGRLAYAPAQPGEGTRWAGPEHDDSGGDAGRVFSSLTPIVYQGRHLATVCTTNTVRGLLGRVLSQNSGVRERFILMRPDGLLIHDTQDAPGQEGTRRTLSPGRKASPPVLYRAILAEARTHAPFPGVDFLAAEDSYYAVARVEGPGWLVAAVLPGQAVRAEALGKAQWAVWTGAAALLMLLAMFAVVLRRQLAAPLGAMTRAAERLAGGELDIRLPDGRRDELGRLARAFNDMAAKVAERDAALRRDKAEIEATLAALRRTEERWRAMTENASDFIVVLTPDGHIAYASPAVGKTLGVETETLLGQPALTLAHPDDVPRLAPLIVQPSGQPVRFRARDARGEWRELEAIASDLRQHPAVGGLVLNIRDITEQVRAEAELARQRETLHQSEKLNALGSLLAGVAHELNNPLSVVVGRAIQLETDLDGTPQGQTAARVRQAAERCGRIVRTFLAMARRQAPRRELTDLNATLRGALEVLAYSLRSSGVETELDLDPGLPHLLADADQLSQVFLNLIGNAQQALADAPMPRRLSLTSRWDGEAGMARIEVADNGPGVPAALRARIFEPFFTTKAVGEGTGMGLSLSLGILQAHGGNLVLAEGGPGARFIITLPVTGAGTGPVFLPPGRPTTDGLRILVVDDEVDIAELLRDYLSAAGHTVSLAHDGHEALARLAAAPRDLIISDLKMPDMDGPALYREITARHPSLTDRVVILTGDTLGGAAQRFLEETGLPVVEKPFDLHAIRDMVARFARLPD